MYIQAVDFERRKAARRADDKYNKKQNKEKL